MDIFLTIIGTLGLGALLIAVYIFTVSARRYVSGECRRAEEEALASDLSPYRRSWVQRSHRDRRTASVPVEFPLRLNNLLIERDRRMNADRRRAA